MYIYKEPFRVKIAEILQELKVKDERILKWFNTTFVTHFASQEACLTTCYISSVESTTSVTWAKAPEAMRMAVMNDEVTKTIKLSAGIREYVVSARRGLRLLLKQRPELTSLSVYSFGVVNSTGIIHTRRIRDRRRAAEAKRGFVSLDVFGNQEAVFLCNSAAVAVVGIGLHNCLRFDYEDGPRDIYPKHSHQWIGVRDVQSGKWTSLARIHAKFGNDEVKLVEHLGTSLRDVNNTQPEADTRSKAFVNLVVFHKQELIKQLADKYAYPNMTAAHLARSIPYTGHLTSVMDRYRQQMISRDEVLHYPRRSAFDLDRHRSGLIVCPSQNMGFIETSLHTGALVARQLRHTHELRFTIFDSVPSNWNWRSPKVAEDEPESLGSAVEVRKTRAKTIEVLKQQAMARESSKKNVSHSRLLSRLWAKL